jgi:hypothetical protein
LSQFDYYGRPLREVWRASADLTPYTVLTPTQPIDEMNPARTRGSEESLKLDLSGPDRSDDELFNHILWEGIKGENVPYPGATRMSMLEVKRGR